MPVLGGREVVRTPRLICILHTAVALRERDTRIADGETSKLMQTAGMSRN
jgi:hypothetical protein